MSERSNKFTDPRAGTAIGVRVITRCRMTEIAGKMEDGTVKVRLIAEAHESPEANQELIAFLAKQLDIQANKIEIAAGSEKSAKILIIEGMSSVDVEAKLGLV